MIALRPYQIEAIDAIHAAWDKSEKALVVAPTGVGKTVIATAAIDKFGPDMRSLTLVHRDELVQQTVDKFAMLGVTDVGVIKADRNDTRAQHIVASVQTMYRENRLAQLGEVHIVWVDEAHHAPASSYQQVLSYLSAQDPYLLGTTATPDRLDKQGLDGTFDRIVYQVDMIGAIRDGYLTDIRAQIITLPGLDLSAVRRRGGDFVEGELAKAMLAANADGAIVQAWLDHSPGMKTVVFVPSVALAHATAAVFQAKGIEAEALEGNTPDDERHGMLDRLKRGITDVVVNCQVLTEGFDEPSIECIIMARPTESRALYQQCIGRGLRPYPGKDACLVLDLVGVTQKHDLITVASLVGAEARDVAAVGVVEAVAIAERERKDKTRRGRAEARDVDILGRKGMNWLRVGKIWAMSLGPDDRGYVVLSQNEVTEDWGVYRLPGQRGLPYTRLAAGLDFDWAMGTGEDLVRAVVPPYLRSREARWRGEPMSMGQIGYFEKKGWPGVPTKGEASDKMNAYFVRWAWANRVAPPRSARQPAVSA